MSTKKADDKVTTDGMYLAKLAYTAYVQNLQPPPSHAGHPTFEGLPKHVRQAWERSATSVYNTVVGVINQQIEAMKSEQVTTPLQ